MALLGLRPLWDWFTGTVAVTAAPATSAAAGGQVFRATSAVTATAGTSATSDREVFQASSGATASAGTCASTENEDFQASCSATAQAGTSASVAQEIFSATVAVTAAPATTQAAATTTISEEESVPPTQGGGGFVRSFVGKYPHFAVITGRVKSKAKRGRSKARGRMILTGSAGKSQTAAVANVTATYQYILIDGGADATGHAATCITRTKPPMVAGRSSSVQHSSEVEHLRAHIRNLEEEMIAVLMAA